MLDIFKGVVRTFRKRRVCTDSLVFRLHHGLTVAFLLLFCILVGLNQFVRKPIVCSGSALPESILNEYCWTHSTFIVDPGLSDSTPSKTHIKHYYQWVFIYLFFQAILFYIPRFLWKNWEGGKLRALKMDLDVGLLAEGEKEEKKYLVLTYLCEHFNTHTSWAYKYFFCEILALINVIGQMFAVNSYLGGTFWSYGVEVLNYTESDQQDRMDPRNHVFPKQVKFVFLKQGPSGALQKHDAFCVLPLNLLYDKIYLFLWFWLVALLVVTSCWIVLRLIVMLSRRARRLVFRARFSFVDSNVAWKIANYFGFGDWFLLCMLGRNADRHSFNEVVSRFVEKREGLGTTRSINEHRL